MIMNEKDETESSYARSRKLPEGWRDIAGLRIHQVFYCTRFGATFETV